jgi:hypothetical protein
MTCVHGTAEAAMRCHTCEKRLDGARRESWNSAIIHCMRVLSPLSRGDVEALLSELDVPKKKKVQA